VGPSGQWFSLGSPVSSTNKIDRHDIAEILLKVALNTIKQTYFPLTKMFQKLQDTVRTIQKGDF
jgi:hypothetical protein